MKAPTDVLKQCGWRTVVKNWPKEETKHAFDSSLSAFASIKRSKRLLTFIHRSFMILRADSASAAKVQTLEAEPFKFNQKTLSAPMPAPRVRRSWLINMRAGFTLILMERMKNLLIQRLRKPSQMIQIPPLNHRRQADVFKWDGIKTDLKAQI